MYRFTDTIQLRPYVKKFICDQETPITLFDHFTKGYAYAFLFESAEVIKGSGRYSFIGFDQRFVLEFPAGGTKNPLKILQEAYKSIQFRPHPELPFFQGGLVGYFNYEVVRHFESLRLPLKNTHIPEGIFYLPRYLLIFDHFEHTLTLVAYEEDDLAKLLEIYKNFTSSTKLTNFALSSNNLEVVKEDHVYLHQVDIAKEKIKAGEVFQIVLSQKFEQQTELAPLEIYRRLRYFSSSPYMFFLRYTDFSIIGSSPETLVKVENGEILVKPIAGTRSRGSNKAEDARLEHELMNDPKEKAEHMMLVDLGRNDVGKVCRPGSVQVKNFMHVQKFSHVMHIISEVSGIRDPRKSLFDIFQAVFPAGTLAGAPKVRAMEIIAELEDSPREIYGGAVGYFGLDGNMDFAIAIRTLLYQNGKVTIKAGAGIVYDSSAESESLECRNKAKGPLLTLSL